MFMDEFVFVKLYSQTFFLTLSQSLVEVIVKGDQMKQILLNKMNFVENILI